MWNKRLTLFVAILVASVFVGCGGGTPADQPFNYTSARVDITDADRDQLVAAARQYLVEGKIDESVLSSTLTKKYNKEVFVWIFAPGTKFMHAHANGETIAQSLGKACQELRSHSSFKKRFADQMDKTRIGVYVMDEVKPITTTSTSKLKGIVEPGIHGLIMVTGGKAYYQLGEEVLFREWGMRGFSDKSRVSGSKMVTYRLRKLANNARLKGKDDWKKDDVTLYYFTEHTAVELTPGGKAFASYRAFMLHPKEMSRSRLLESAWLAARHLAMHTSDEGQLGYHYRAAVDEFASDKYYNIVRHAGSVWALFQAYKATGDIMLHDAGLRALGYLRKEIKIAAENKEVAFLDYRGKSYLGTNALTLMSLVEIPTELVTPELKELRDKLANGILAFQVEDGRFYKTWKEVLKGGPVPDPQPMYFPGEAFLALVKLYEIDPNPKWLAAANKCAEAQRRGWDANPKQQPDAWVVQAMSRLYPITKDEKLPEYVFKMVAWHFKNEWGMPEKKETLVYADYFGGADNSTPPRSTPTSARNEANIEAWALARAVGNAEMEKKLGDAVMASYWHNTVDQIRPETAYFYPSPEKAIGGVRGSLISNDIRIDYNQHFLSAALNGLALAEQRHGVGELGPLSKGKILDVGKLGIDPAVAAKQLAGEK